MQNIAIIGREKSLAYAEMESVFGDINKVGRDTVIFTGGGPESIKNLGSVIKIGQIFEECTTSSNYLGKIIDHIASHFASSSVRSIDYGISVYGNQINDKTYKNILIQIKKGLRQKQIKSRFVVPKKQLELNAAQVIHNNLIGTGIEIIITGDDANLILAETTQIQDIDSYSLRDFGRPSRDMKIGMFPPKLAQIMLNLADFSPQAIVYDPFCGSGVVLQEAMLRGNTSWGSDIAEAMVRSTTENINWLTNQYNLSIPFDVFIADATRIDKVPEGQYSIVTEGYLGTMLSNTPTPDQIEQLRGELSHLYLNFLKKIKSLSNQPQSIVLSLPCWQTKEALNMLEIIDQINNLGYTVKQFKSVETNNLIYKREEQIVGRQIVVLQPHK